MKEALHNLRGQISALQIQLTGSADATSSVGGVDRPALLVLQGRLTTLEDRLQSVTHERDALSPLMQATFLECEALKGAD